MKYIKGFGEETWGMGYLGKPRHSCLIILKWIVKKYGWFEQGQCGLGQGTDGRLSEHGSVQ